MINGTHACLNSVLAGWGCNLGNFKARITDSGEYGAKYRVFKASQACLERYLSRKGIQPVEYTYTRFKGMMSTVRVLN